MALQAEILIIVIITSVKIGISVTFSSEKAVANVDVQLQ